MPPPWALIGLPEVSSQTSPGRNTASAACPLVAVANRRRLHSPQRALHRTVFIVSIDMALAWCSRICRHGLATAHYGKKRGALQTVARSEPQAIVTRVA